MWVVVILLKDAANLFRTGPAWLLPDRFVEQFDKVDSTVGIVRALAQPNNHAVSIAIDLLHELHLVTPLFRVCQIDAD
jgi:hypothetical protein